MNKEEIINILRINAEEIVKPYFDSREEIIKQIREKTIQNNIRLEQITLEKNRLRLGLERLRDNKEEEIEEYLRNITSSTKNVREQLEKEYEKKESDYESQIRLLDEEEIKLRNVDYSNLIYENKLPGKKEKSLAQLGKLIEEIQNQIERKEIEIKLVDIDVRNVRNQFLSSDIGSELEGKLAPYYNQKQSLLKQIEQLEELQEQVKKYRNIIFNDEELKNYIKNIYDFNNNDIKSMAVVPKINQINIQRQEVTDDEQNSDDIEDQNQEITDDEQNSDDIEDQNQEITDDEQNSDDIENDIDELDISLDEIIYKVCGTKSFNDKESSKYSASKIKVFSKLEKNNLGLAYKIVSIPRTIIGIIPRTAMKIYGSFLTQDTRQVFEEMEERANKLTDKEIEKVLNEYKGALAQGKRIPKGFNNAIRARANKYVSIKVANINQQIKENLEKINYCEKVINCLNEKQKQVTDLQMQQRISEVLDTTYTTASKHIKNLISLQIEGNNLQNGNGLHSFEEELKALDTKLNYLGGRFSKSREYNPELWKHISGYSHKIEYSLDPKEVVDSYIKREKVYKEKTQEKRSILNLGSKVTVGELDYRPFVESLNYGNDPFIRDLITSILVISSTASLINNITNNIKQNIEINEINKQITESNKSIAEHQNFVKTVRDNGGTIEKGIISDIKQTEGAVENLAERGINDKFGWNLSGKNYVAEDAAHHIETANLSLQNTKEILDLSNKYSSGTITYAEYLKGIQTLKENTTTLYQSYAQNLHTHIENYASSHSQFDYTAVLSALKHAISNPNDSANLTDFMTELYEKSLNISDLQSLDLIEKTVVTDGLVPDLLTIGAVTAKISQEEMDSEKENNNEIKKVQEIREMIESLKSMKQDLSEEEIKEIEAFLK